MSPFLSSSGYPDLRVSTPQIDLDCTHEAFTLLLQQYHTMPFPCNAALQVHRSPRARATSNDRLRQHFRTPTCLCWRVGRQHVPVVCALLNPRNSRNTLSRYLLSTPFWGLIGLLNYLFLLVPTCLIVFECFLMFLNDFEGPRRFEEVRGGSRRFEKIREASRKLEKVREGLRKYDKSPRRC